jgi:hypothetical protein
MRLQFSILTMLVCTAALAVATAICIAVPVHWHFEGPTQTGAYMLGDAWVHPTAGDLGLRMAWAGPLAVMISLCLLRASPRLLKRLFAHDRVS